MVSYVADAIIISIMIYAAAMDLRSYKVKNEVFILGWCIALMLRFLTEGGYGILHWAAGVVVPIGLLIPLFGIRAIGGADVKAFSVIGAFWGINKVITIIILAFIMGAIISLATMLIHKNLFIRLRYLAEYFSDLVRTKQLKKYCVGKYTDDMVIHFMVPIGISAILTCIWI